MAENTIDNLSIEVTASADRAARVFDRLASSAGRLRGAASGAAGGLQDMAHGARDAGTATAIAGEQAGQAQPRIRGVGNAAKDAGDNAKKGASGLATFWQSLKRIAFYRFIRSVIKEISSAFSEGIKNLYHWSDLINGHFAASMDRLATSSQYLKNSFAAMVSPLIETLVPVLDVIIDKVVDVLNFFNMLVSAISGADTYTVAKKAAAVWDDSASKTKKAAKSAASELKRTILGFDEINKLVKQNTTSGSGGNSSGKTTPDYGAMFEEKPLTGLFKKISDITSGWPDWLKALLGIGTAGLAIFGIPALLRTIWDWLKKLFTLKIPDFFKWLFGPKGDGNFDLNLPDKIDLPDADVKTNLKKGDWNVLKEVDALPVHLAPIESARYLYDTLQTNWNRLQSKTLFINIMFSQSALLLFAMFQSSWNGMRDKTLYLNVALSQSAQFLFDTLKRAWDALTNRTLYLNIAPSQTAKYLFDNLKKTWDSLNKKTLYFNVAISQTAKYLYDTLKKQWDSLPNKTMYFNASISQSAQYLFDTLKKEWQAIRDKTMYFNVTISQSARYLFDTLKKAWDTMSNRTLYINVQLVKSGWTTLASFVGTYSPIVYVRLGKSAWSTLADFVGTYSPIVYVMLAKWGWYSIEGWIGDTNIYASVYLWRGNFWNLQYWIGDCVDVDVYLYRGNFWSLQDWVGSQVTVSVNLAMGNGGTITVNGGGSSSNNSGGGGSMSGGGAGRGRHALGGVYSNGVWSSIPQYAYGNYGVSHGTLFWAGERGSEIVGNAGGRTEVLNRSQIASAIYSAVTAAMAPAAANFAAAAQYMGGAESGYDEDMLSDMIQHAVEAAMSRSNDYDRQKVDLLRQINDKDLTVEYSTSAANKAQTRMNRRAGVTVVAVGH